MEWVAELHFFASRTRAYSSALGRIDVPCPSHIDPNDPGIGPTDEFDLWPLEFEDGDARNTDGVFIICRELPIWRRLVPRLQVAMHCSIGCCKFGVCNYYGLGPEDPQFPPSGPVRRRQDYDFDRPIDGDSGYRRYRTWQNASACDCLAKATIANQSNPWNYNFLNCNSNWYASSLLKCCVGENTGAPPPATGWGRCCIDAWLPQQPGDGPGGGGGLRTPAPCFKCPKGSPGQNSKYIQRCNFDDGRQPEALDCPW